MVTHAGVLRALGIAPTPGNAAARSATLGALHAALRDDGALLARRRLPACATRRSDCEPERVAATRGRAPPAIAVLGGLAIALAGAPWIGAALIAGAVALARRRVRGRRSRAVAPERGDATAATRSRARSHAAVAADLLLGAAWETSARFRRVPDLPRAAEDVASAVARWRERGWLERPEAAHRAAAAAREAVDRDAPRAAAPATAEHLCSRASSRRRIRRSPRRIARTARIATRTRCSSAIAAARRARR